MKATENGIKEVDFKFLKMYVPIENGEIPDGFPHINGEQWTPLIDIDTGQILNWENGKSGVVKLMVGDKGKFQLMDELLKVLVTKENSYVPNELIPGDMGETIDLEIDSTGKIVNWYTEPSLEGFFKD